MEGLHKILDVFGRLFCLVSESLGLDYTWTVQQIESTSNDISSVLNGKLVTETAPAVCRRFVEKEHLQSVRKRQIMRLVELTFLCQTLKNTKKLIVF